MNDTSKGAVLHPAQMKAHERGGGAKTIPLVGPRIGAKSFLNGMTIFGPGAAIAEIDGERHAIKAGDISWIPEGVPHRFINASSTEGMRILWIYARTDATRTLVETGETRPVLAEHQD